MLRNMKLMFGEVMSQSTANALANPSSLEGPVMIEKLETSWTNALDLESVPDILNEHARKINEIIDKMKEQIDYEKLLVKYIKHVGECEGIDFLEDHHQFSSSQVVQFTREEWRELKMLSLSDLTKH